MPDNLGAPLDYSGLPPDVLAGLQLVNLGPGLPSQPAIQQHPAAQQAAGGVPDLATALRQLVQVAQTPQHPHQQTALRQLVHLALLHHAMTRGTGAQAAPQPQPQTPQSSNLVAPTGPP